jgi:hypothetical protein
LRTTTISQFTNAGPCIGQKCHGAIEPNRQHIIILVQGFEDAATAHISAETPKPRRDFLLAFWINANHARQGEQAEGRFQRHAIRVLPGSQARAARLGGLAFGIRARFAKLHINPVRAAPHGHGLTRHRILAQIAVAAGSVAID